MVRILVVAKDDNEVRQACKYLEANGFETVTTNDDAEAESIMAQGEAAMALLDAELSVAETLGKNRSVAGRGYYPIIFITPSNVGDFADLGFKFGVDDLIVKPYNPAELVHRVIADAIRARLTAPDTIILGNFRMNGDEHVAYYNGKPLPLTVREFDILFKLVSNPKKTFTRSQLMASFWDTDSTAGSRTIDVYMAKIREKIAQCEEFEIVTMHGLGYKAIIHALPQDIRFY